MDSLTQACLGAAVGGAVLGRPLGRKALVAGAVLGTLPDLDVLIDYGDAVADYTYHRGFSHSLLVLGALATLLALVTARFTPLRHISLKRWWLFYGACLLTHPVLDALTAYGTQLLWPLSTPPASWGTIFIIDPLYTLPLFLAVAYGLFRGYRPRSLAWGLALSSVYLLFSLGGKWTIDARMDSVLTAQGLENAPRLVQPTPFNTLLWRVTVIDGEDYREALVGLFDTQPPLFERFSRGTRYENVALDTASGQRLYWFAGPFLSYRTQASDEAVGLIATDLRLGVPGFHPFSFLLATRNENGWEPTTTQLLPERPVDQGALTLLASRVFSPTMRLCPSAFAGTPQAGPSDACQAARQ
ncbi:inner membrane protein [Modicisalibacter ilicicola DSM 19980]|uniref:Inner membrane protein n=1 Tax=Modicisalibacter ilicicola DSM 19980 TaxID=1121942 RepID=A0A1M5EU73_9GAMM|nr:metal-dependent hydrolase [Halomonas ilicicola]SHF82686.1 inner membrane protein [Halomonas ilicicola DSM 19980]